MTRPLTSMSMSELAEWAGQDLRTFQDGFRREDLKAMIDLGWDPFGRTRKMPPNVVRYVVETFIDSTIP